MTWLKTIFPLYLLILTCMPCADNCDDKVMQPTQATISANNTHSHNDKQKESCSPFCTCDCCSIRVSAPTLLSFTTNVVIVPITKQFSNYAFSFQTVLHNIWQPPQLS